MALVLLIDDDPFFRNVFRRMLEGGGHAVIEAEDGAEGIEAYKQHRPAVAIVDIYMPDIEGGEVIRRLKEFHADSRIIAISGSNAFHEDLEYIDRLKGIGVQAVLRKVDSKEVVLGQIEQALRATAR